jgi:hypothetical protein
MSEIFDDLARILGSRLPRREALRLILGGLAGSCLGPLWPRWAASEAVPHFLLEKRHADPLCVPKSECNEANGDVIVGDLCCKKGQGTPCGPRDVTPGKGCMCCPPQRPFCCQKKDDETVHECCKNEQCCNPSTGECTGAGFRVSSYRAGPPSTLEVGIQSYGGVGLASVSVVESLNAAVDIPQFPPGTPYVEVKATRIDPARPARMVLRACPDCGCQTCCEDGDPALTVLRIAHGEREARDSFANLGAAESFVTVQNGAPGVPRVRVLVNGRQVGALRLSRNEVRTIDVGWAMMRSRNIITVVAEGQPGHSALVIVSDRAEARKTAHVQPFIVWEGGDPGDHESPHWGR